MNFPLYNAAMRAAMVAHGLEIKEPENQRYDELLELMKKYDGVTKSIKEK